MDLRLSPAAMALNLHHAAVAEVATFSAATAMAAAVAAR
jgi:hypothetical protein